MSRSAAIVLGCGGFPESLLSNEKKKEKEASQQGILGARVTAQWAKQLLGEPKFLGSRPPAPNKNSDLSTGIYNPRGPLRGRESFDLAQNMKRKTQQRTCLKQEVRTDLQGSPLSSTCVP